MSLNGTGMLLLAGVLQETLLYAQLHSGLAGVGGTDNIAIVGRQPVNWNTPVATGNFGLISLMSFTGGNPGADVYSVTLWDAETGGVFYGEHPLTGDVTFNALGDFQVTAIDFTGISS